MNTAVRTGKMLEVPLSYHIPKILAAFGLSYVILKANDTFVNVYPSTYSSEFIAEQKKIGDVVQRIEASPVFLNPIRNRIPGSVLGPEDLVEADEQ